ncbi:hypothetical protein [Agrobacterium radiobacter]|uniref:hypothetical protein n=1 Tax=Agrobacterium radiobacter TaxID=362 RepID=UPI003F829639
MVSATIPNLGAFVMRQPCRQLGFSKKPSRLISGDKQSQGRRVKIAAARVIYLKQQRWPAEIGAVTLNIRLELWKQTP